MTAPDAIRTAFLQRDFSIAAPHLADGVVFRSPVLERPWTTRPVLERLGPAMVDVFDELVVEPPLRDGSAAILRLSGSVGGVGAQALLELEGGADGTVTEMAIFVRPLPALLAVARAMEARVDPELLAGHLA